jgi:hypothetical protein
MMMSDLKQVKKAIYIRAIVAISVISDLGQAEAGDGFWNPQRRGNPVSERRYGSFPNPALLASFISS